MKKIKQKLSNVFLFFGKIFYFIFKFTEWEKKIFEPKLRHIREAMATKTSSKLSKIETKKQNITQHLQINAVNATTYIPLVWIQDYNDSTWNDTESNVTFTNITIIPTKRKDNLIFGYFRFAIILICNILV